MVEAWPENPALSKSLEYPDSLQFLEHATSRESSSECGVPEDDRVQRRLNRMMDYAPTQTEHRHNGAGSQTRTGRMKILSRKQEMLLIRAHRRC